MVLICCAVSLNYADQGASSLSLGVSQDGAEQHRCVATAFPLMSCTVLTCVLRCKSVHAALSTKKEIKSATITMLRNIMTLAQTLQPVAGTIVHALDRHVLTCNHRVASLDYEAALPRGPHTARLRAVLLSLCDRRLVWLLPLCHCVASFCSFFTEAPLTFADKPVKLKLGHVRTPYHTLSLKAQTTLDTVPHEASQDGTANTCSTLVPSPAPTPATPAQPSADEGSPTSTFLHSPTIFRSPCLTNERAKELVGDSCDDETQEPTPASEAAPVEVVVPASQHELERKALLLIRDLPLVTISTLRWVPDFTPPNISLTGRLIVNN